MRERKIRFFALALVALVGFFTGLNYYSSNSFEEIKGCFEFGFASIMCAETLGENVKKLLLSAAKNFLLLFSGAYFSFLLPITFFTLFGINFKMGVFLACVAKTLSLGGIVEILFVFLLAAIVFLLSLALSFFVLEKNIQFRISKRFDYFEGIFILKSIGFLVAFVALVFIFLLACRFTNNSIFGFFNTYL